MSPRSVALTVIVAVLLGCAAAAAEATRSPSTASASDAALRIHKADGTYSEVTSARPAVTNAYPGRTAGATGAGASTSW